MLAKLTLVVAVAFIVWHLLVLFPLYDLGRSSQYADILKVIEEKSEIRFDPMSPFAYLGEGGEIDGGLPACGEICLKPYCNIGQRQDFFYRVNSGHLGLENKSGLTPWLNPREYVQNYSGACENIKITSVERSDYEKYNTISKNFQIIKFEYNSFYHLIGVKFEVSVEGMNNYFRSASITMDKKNSLLRGIPDDTSGFWDQESTSFTWLDVMRSRL